MAMTLSPAPRDRVWIKKYSDNGRDNSKSTEHVYNVPRAGREDEETKSAITEIGDERYYVFGLFVRPSVVL